MSAFDGIAAITQAVAVTPSDSTDLAKSPTDAINVSVSGTVYVDFYANEKGALASSNIPVYLAAGVFHPLRVKRIRQTGTSAGVITACYNQ